MVISESDLLKMATAYIENGVVKKWRYDSNDKDTMDYKLNLKQVLSQTVTEDELEYIKTLNNVVIAKEHNVEFINFSGTALKL